LDFVKTRLRAIARFGDIGSFRERKAGYPLRSAAGGVSKSAFDEELSQEFFAMTTMAAAINRSSLPLDPARRF
jgi:hypothetical protein